LGKITDWGRPGLWKVENILILEMWLVHFGFQ
jgi:hypothetical protein